MWVVLAGVLRGPSCPQVQRIAIREKFVGRNSGNHFQLARLLPRMDVVGMSGVSHQSQLASQDLFRQS